MSQAAASIIESWLSEIARRALADQATPRFRNRLTNIRAWTAASAAVAAIASGDRGLLEEAADQARSILETVTTDGALPAELARGRRAFHYHVWALEPLALTVLAAERNGLRLAAVNDGALGRLAEFVIASASDPDRIARLLESSRSRESASGRVTGDCWHRDRAGGSRSQGSGRRPPAEAARSIPFHGRRLVAGSGPHGRRRRAAAALNFDQERSVAVQTIRSGRAVQQRLSYLRSNATLSCRKRLIGIGRIMMKLAGLPRRP